MMCLAAFAQKTITGTVKDASGEPMIGVTILLDGKPVSVTDLDGNFSVPNAASSSKLKISYVGYKDKTLSVGNSSKIDIVMEEDNNALEELVVVGYGTMKKTDLTGSVSSVGTEKLNSKGSPNVMESLQGSVAGVNITQSTGRTNGDFNIEIRGKSSTNSDTNPIYVVDGVICDDISFLNQQDIERIDVLKDASSTAIYGSRATAGVVMVTTKSGTTVGKRTVQKPTISYDGYYGVTKVARMPDFMNGQEFYNYRFLKFLSYAEGASNNAMSGHPAYQMGTYSQMAICATDANTDSRLKEMMANGQTYDWPSLVTQNGHQQNHYLAASGSTENINYHIGLGYNSVEGIYKNDSQDKINFKGSVDAKLNKYISTGFSINLAHINNDYAYDNAISSAFSMNPFMIPYDEDGNRILKPGNKDALGTTGNQFTDTINPLFKQDIYEKNRETWRMLGNFYLQVNPMDGLTLKTTFSPTYTNYREGEFYNPKDLMDMGAAAADLDKKTDITANYITNRNFSWTWDNTITWDKTFDKKHHINLMGLFSMLSGNTEGMSAYYTGVRAATKWWNLASGTVDATNTNNSYTEYSMISYALRANYTLLDRYMLTATVRWDGSSRFADGHKWGSFPSFAAAWRMSEEKWMKNIDWLSNLKLRLSYGVTGNNSGVSNFPTHQSVEGPVFYPFGSKTYYTGYYSGAVVNKGITWEESDEVNFGVDFGFLNNRINGSVDIYEKNSKNLLYQVELPLEAGGVKMKTNVGKVRNRGIEIALNTVNVETKDWHWETSFTFAKNKNEVREINGLGKDLPGEGLFIGKPFNNIYGYDWTGIVSDKNMVVPNKDIAIAKGLTPGTIMKESDYYYTCYGLTEGLPIIDDVNGDGSFDDDDKKVWSSDPSWTGSMNSYLSYKNWDFSFSIYTKQDVLVESSFLGGKLLDYSDRGRQHLNVDYYIPAGTLIDCDGVNADGTYINPVYQQTTKYGKYPFPNNGASSGGLGSVATPYNEARSYTDASFVKVKNITLGYTLPRTLLSKAGISNLRLYCTVTNPFVFTDYKGFDPEWAAADAEYDGPSTVSWEFGASLKF